MENKRESDNFQEILENLEIRDSSSEKTPFEMALLSGPELSSVHATLSCKNLCCASRVCAGVVGELGGVAAAPRICSKGHEGKC